MGCFLGCGSGMLNWCMNIDQQHGEDCHSSCSTLAHDRGKNNAPTDPPRVVGKKGLMSSLLYLVGCRLLWLSRSRVTPPLLRKTRSPSATPRRDLLGARKHLRNGMVGRDGEGVEDFHCLDFCVVASDSSPSISAVSPYE